nr:MAG TPA: hypothetical protein [Caudoviricetes sp.]
MAVLTRPTKTLNCWELLKLRILIWLGCISYESRNKFLR